MAYGTLVDTNVLLDVLTEDETWLAWSMDALTAAHPRLPFGSWVRVRNLVNGRSVDVRINDRGPHIKRRVIDLSRAAARALRIGGVAAVEVRRLTHDEILSGAWKLPVQQVAKSP